MYVVNGERIGMRDFILQALKDNYEVVVIALAGVAGVVTRFSFDVKEGKIQPTKKNFWLYQGSNFAGGIVMSSLTILYYGAEPVPTPALILATLFGSVFGMTIFMILLGVFKTVLKTYRNGNSTSDK